MTNRAPHWPKRPYKGLRFYSPSDTPLFAGRSAEIAECTDELLRSEVCLFILDGESGCGKSSFLRAGLLPFLNSLRTGVNDSALAGEGRSRLSEAETIIRVGRLPYEDLSRAVFAEIDRARRAGLSGRRLRAIRLDATSADEFVAVTRRGGHKLFAALQMLSLESSERRLLVLDQAENAFSSSNEDERADQDRYFSFLTHLSNVPIDLKLLIALRSEYKGLFDDRLRKASAEFARIGAYHLPPMSRLGMLEAIKRPTRREPISVYGRTFSAPYDSYGFLLADGVPELIADDLWADVRYPNPQTLLPLLQVICDRLHSYWLRSRRSRKSNDTITEADYRATGAATTQVGSHLEDALVDYYLRYARDVHASTQADRWRRVLISLTALSSDRPVAAPAVPVSTIVTSANREGCHHPDGMLRWLSSPDRYILEESNGARAYRLVHDQVAVALVNWARSSPRSLYHAVTPAGESLQHDDRWTTTDLFTRGGTPRTQVFVTFNDLIWDHQILLYAQHKGFAGRLGLQFETPRRYDLAAGGSELQYKSFLAEAARDGAYRVAVLPPRVFPEIKRHPWYPIGISNRYLGFALIGRASTSRDDSSRATALRLQSRLRSVVAALLRPGVRVIAFEHTSEVFFKTLMTFGGNRRRPRVEVANGHFRNQARDAMFTALIEGHADYAMGPAPSRALAEQAGLSTLIDYQQLLAAVPRQLVNRVRDLALAELCASDVPPDNAPTRLRLLALLLYTAAHIREHTDDFVEFLFNNQLTATRRGAYRIRREFIRAAVDASYAFTSLDRYTYEHFTASPQHDWSSGRASSPVTLFEELLGNRAACDALFAVAARTPPSSPARVAALARAQRHYQIYNFYDAHMILRHERDGARA